MKQVYDIEKEDLYRMYVEEQISSVDIAKKYGCTSHTVRNRLRSYEIPRKQKNGKFQEPFYVNDNYFEVWSEDMAWVLGYIAADGCIGKRGYHFQIKSIDYEMLEFVKQQLNTNYKVTKCKGTNCYMLTIYSKKIVGDLLELGISKQKSLTVDLPKMDVKYFWSFLRGLIDGDGHILPVKKNSRQIKFQITSSYYMLNSIMDLLEKEIGMKRYKINPQGKAGCIAMSGKWAYKIFKRVYDNDFYGLSRKKNMALKSLKAYENKKRCIGCDKELLFVSVRSERCKKCAFERNQQIWSDYGRKWYEDN